MVSQFTFEVNLQSGKIKRVDNDIEFAAMLGTRVLIVEDNIVNREVAVGLLEAMGWETDCAVNGEDAIIAFQERGPYDLILMDIQMPKLDGLEATKAIRALEAAGKNQKPTPIVALTANVMTETKDACEQAGMNGFVSKPVYRDQLEETIREVLEI